MRLKESALAMMASESARIRIKEDDSYNPPYVATWED